MPPLRKCAAKQLGSNFPIPRSDNSRREEASFPRSRVGTFFVPSAAFSRSIRQPIAGPLLNGISRFRECKGRVVNSSCWTGKLSVLVTQVFVSTEGGISPGAEASESPPPSWGTVSVGGIRRRTLRNKTGMFGPERQPQLFTARMRGSAEPSQRFPC
jgi:hypothetical protein